MKLARNITISLLATTLTSCAYFNHSPVMQGRDKHYLTAHSNPPLRIPPGLSSSSFRNDYPIPQHSYPESAKIVSVIPPGLNTGT